MQNNGEKYGWTEITENEATARANKGHPAIAIWKNVNGEHGHIAMISPQKPGDRGTMIAQAGSTLHNYDSIETGFGGVQGIKFYTHD